MTAHVKTLTDLSLYFFIFSFSITEIVLSSKDLP